MKNGQCQKSPVFSSKYDNQVNWQLECYPNGGTKAYNSYVSIYVSLLKSDRPELTAHVELSIFERTKQGNIKECFGNDCDEYTFSLKSGSEGWGFNRLILLKDLLEKFEKAKENAITLECKLCYEVEVNVEPFMPSKVKKPRLEEPEQHQLKLADYLGQFFDSGKMADITFIIGNRELKAHKLVLSARSSVFAEMFESSSSPSRLKLEDTELNAFQDLLNFVYKDVMPNMEEAEDRTKKMLAIAERYKVPLFKIKCEEILIKYISVNNCAELLLLADAHGASLLRQHALDYFCRHKEEIIKTAGWMNLKQNRLDLAVSILESTVSKTA